MSLVFDAVLCLLVLGVGWRVVAAPAALPAAIAFIAYGLLLGLAWVRLAAVDVALTEVAVGSGIAGIVLLRAAARVPQVSAAPSAALRLGAAVLSLLVAGGLAVMVLGLPEPAPTLAGDVARHMPATGLGNPVTGVLMVFRALDTVLEMVVLLLALIAVWALALERDWRNAPPPLWPGPAPAPVDFLARILVPVGLLVGFYQLWAGADVPGGKFQGAALLAAMGLLLMMAGRMAPPEARSLRLRVLLLAGPFAFLAVGVAGFAMAGTFLGYPPGFEKPVIVAVEVAATASVAVTLALLVLGPPAGERRP